jgi:hypothetical protein
VNFLISGLIFSSVLLSCIHQAAADDKDDTPPVVTRQEIVCCSGLTQTLATFKAYNESALLSLGKYSYRTVATYHAEVGQNFYTCHKIEIDVEARRERKRLMNSQEGRQLEEFEKNARSQLEKAETELASKTAPLLK